MEGIEGGANDYMPKPFRFEFNDSEVLAGDCISANLRPRGAC